LEPAKRRSPGLYLEPAKRRSPGLYLWLARSPRSGIRISGRTLASRAISQRFFALLSVVVAHKFAKYIAVRRPHLALLRPLRYACAWRGRRPLPVLLVLQLQQQPAAIRAALGSMRRPAPAPVVIRTYSIYLSPPTIRTPFLPAPMFHPLIISTRTLP